MNGRLGKVLVVVATIALVGVSFTHWIDGESFWQGDHSLHLKVGISAAVLIAAALSVAAMRGGAALSRLAGAAALFAGGGVVMYTLELTSFPYHFVVWVALLLGGAIALGGLLTVFEDLTPAVGARRADGATQQPEEPVPGSSVVPEQALPAGQTSQTAPMAPPKAADLTEPLAARVPAGWYPDPSGEHEERLWDGSTWTHEVRSSATRVAPAEPGPSRMS